MAVLAPTPRASVSTAMRVKAGLFARTLRPYRTSCKNEFKCHLVLLPGMSDGLASSTYTSNNAPQGVDVPAFLLVAEGVQRVNTHGAASGNPAGDKSNCDEDQ